MKIYKNCKRPFLLLLIVSLLTANLASCSNSDSKVSKSGFYFDTVITITLYGTNSEKYIDEAFELADHYEKLFSNTVDGSDISNINQNPGSYVKVDSDTIDLIKLAINYCDQTQGKFDITIGKIADLWNFSEVSANVTTENNSVDNSYIPSDSEIQSLLAHVNYKNISIKDDSVCLNDDDSKIDLGAVAKGYIADRMKEYLNKEGISAGTINLGGNVLTIGEKADKQCYNIGIQKPFSEDGEAYFKVMVDDKSVVTSGIYERYFTVDGKIYHHILDSSTGYPIENNLYSVTILSDSSAQGDALSTTCFLLGLEDGMNYIESLDGVEAIFITDDMQLHVTSGLSEGKDYDYL